MQYCKKTNTWIKHIYFQSERWRRRRLGLGCPDSGSLRPSLAAPQGWSPPVLDSRVTTMLNQDGTLFSIRRNHRKCNISQYWRSHRGSGGKIVTFFSSSNLLKIFCPVGVWPICDRFQKPAGYFLGRAWSNSARILKASLQSNTFAPV